MMSIRARLFLILLAATGAVWLSAVVWIQRSTQAQVEQVLDARLAEAARMVASLVADRSIAPRDAARAGATSAGTGRSYDYSHQISCQIWQFDGHLLAHSEAAPNDRLTATTAGYSTSTADGETWRVFTVSDPKQGIRVMVGDRLTVRTKLVDDVTRGLLLPAIVILPILAALIWLALDRGLAPLNRMAAELSRQGARDLAPLPEGPAPREIRPVSRALNGLIRRLAAAREAERQFTAAAAHELKTPLAGLKTQAQIAELANDEDTRRDALARLVRGVDRTDRMVKQLLALARIDSGPDGRTTPVPIPLAAAFDEIAADLGALARTRQVVLRPQAPAPTVTADRLMLTLALRNLVENAIHASPEGATVEIAATALPAATRIEIRDRGPGIPDADRARVRERFFRGSGANAPGSGLGLPIVEAAVQILGGGFGLTPRGGGGEIAWIELPHPTETA